MEEGKQGLFASKSKTFLVFCFCILIGAAAWSLHDKKCTQDEICSFDSRLITFSGEIIGEPDRRIENSQYVVQVGAVEKWGKRHGKVLVTTKNYPEYYFGDMLTIRCQLRRPHVDETTTFRYDKYLAEQNIFIICSYPQFMEKTGHRDHLVAYFLAFKQRISEQIGRLWPETASSFMAGLLYGSRAGLPNELKQAFSKSGISHIVAVSGFNISIIVRVALQVLVYIGLWRRQAFWVVLGLIIFFVVFTGASASVVRAGLMGTLVLIGDYVGRPAHITIGLIAAAAFMVLFNPYLVLWDIGFQLSFLSTAGLVHLSTPLKTLLPWLTKWPLIEEVLSATLAAQVATLPLILYYFGQLSLIAPLANILVLWIIPWLMLAGFLALVASFIFYPFGQLIAWVAQLGLNYVLAVATWCGRQPWSAIAWPIPGIMILIYYSTLGIFLKKYEQRQSKNI